MPKVIKMIYQDLEGKTRKGRRQTIAKNRVEKIILAFSDMFFMNSFSS